ncbi:MAG: permease, partial [bacterium]|nr:permease [bacterium]
MLTAILKEIGQVLIQMAPYLFIGLTFAGILHVFFDRTFIVKHLGKNNFLSVI